MTLCLTCRNEGGCIETDLRKIRGECEYYKPITNADRIRGMSDEELAEYLSDIAGWMSEYEGKAHALLK